MDFGLTDAQVAIKKPPESLLKRKLNRWFLNRASFSRTSHFLKIPGTTPKKAMILYISP